MGPCGTIPVAGPRQEQKVTAIVAHQGSDAQSCVGDSIPHGAGFHRDAASTGTARAGAAGVGTGGAGCSTAGSTAGRTQGGQPNRNCMSGSPGRLGRMAPIRKIATGRTHFIGNFQRIGSRSDIERRLLAFRMSRRNGRLGIFQIDHLGKKFSAQGGHDIVVRQLDHDRKPVFQPFGRVDSDRRPRWSETARLPDSTGCSSLETGTPAQSTARRGWARSRLP